MNLIAHSFFEFVFEHINNYLYTTTLSKLAIYILIEDSHFISIILSITLKFSSKQCPKSRATTAVTRCLISVVAGICEKNKLVKIEKVSRFLS